jgi:hypothetical protein
VKGDKMKIQRRESDTGDAVVRYLGSCLAFMVLLRWFGGFDSVFLQQLLFLSTKIKHLTTICSLHCLR